MGAQWDDGSVDAMWLGGQSDRRGRTMTRCHHCPKFPQKSFDAFDEQSATNAPFPATASSTEPDLDVLSDLSDLTPLPSDAESSEDEDERPKKRRRVIRTLLPFPLQNEQHVQSFPTPTPSASAGSFRPAVAEEASSTPPTLTRSQQKGRKKRSGAKVHAHNKQMRNNRRETRAEALLANNGVKAISLKRHSEETAVILPAFDATSLLAATGAWVGRRQWFKPTRRDLASILAAGIQVIAWDGRLTHPMVDAHSRMFLLMAAGPRGPNWKQTIIDGGRRIEKARKHMRFKKEQLEHIRGISRPLQQASSTAEALRRNQRVMDELLRSSELTDVARHNDRIFQMHNPLLFNAYDEVLSFVMNGDESLRRTWASSPFASTTVNFGPRVICDDHVDSQNLPWGIAIEFPAGASIYLPSALLVHSNVEIQQGERRYSVTSYSSGGLFRWAWNGGRTDEEYDDEFGKEEGKRRRTEHAATAWQDALKYFPI
ncbi:hypothetical protein BDZ89DRAFT_1055116 [Hymenopellis radicata]|nr:hypothetical protein BDZ89DRAFT_1055116 [Hymenopellis radicata]